MRPPQKNPAESHGDRISRTANFNFEVAALNGYAVAMSRKTGSGSNNGSGDVIGVALLAVALLLLVAQLSFDRYDLSFFRDPHNKPIHNWIGPLGAYLAWGTFSAARPGRLIFCRGCWRRSARPIC